MPFLPRVRSLWRNLAHAGQVERELDDELRAYVDLLAAEKEKAGMTPDDDRRAARLEAGGVDQLKESVRDAHAGAAVESTLQDLRYGVRLLTRAPGFAALVVLTIALGIGANSAIFSVINAVVRKPLGYPQSDRLMFITSQFPTLGFDKFWVSPPEYFEFRERNRAFEEVGAYTVNAANLGEAGAEPMRVTTAYVTAPLMTVLGVAPQRGRALADADG